MLGPSFRVVCVFDIARLGSSPGIQLPDTFVRQTRVTSTDSQTQGITDQRLGVFCR